MKASTDVSITAYADALRLRQVVVNVITNAIKYNREIGSVDVTVGLPADGHVPISIIDPGIGMSESQLARLFLPFNRLGRERSEIEGSGIGLSLARELTRAMGGSLEVSSSEGSGTVVQIRLRVAGDPGTPADAAFTSGSEFAAKSDDQSGIASLRPPQQLFVRGKGDLAGTVLYIEDSLVNALVVQQHLGAYRGLDVLHAVDGWSGIERARSERPNLILLDLQLPDISGYEVLEALGNDPLTRYIPTVVLSATASEASVRQALMTGAREVWTNPLDLATLESGVRRC